MSNPRVNTVKLIFEIIKKSKSSLNVSIINWGNGEYKFQIFYKRKSKTTSHIQSLLQNNDITYFMKGYLNYIDIPITPYLKDHYLSFLNDLEKQECINYYNSRNYDTDEEDA